MDAEKATEKSASKKCIESPNAQIYNRITSSKGDWSVNKTISIFNESNSVVIKQADYAEIVTKVEKDSKIAYRIQDHKQSNPAYNTTAVPAVVVKFTKHDTQVVSLDIMESLPGTEFNKDDIHKRYTLAIDSAMFFLYGNVVKNDLEVAESMATKKHGKKTIDLT
ncbi:hypothetical protein [Sulfuricurvum sp.]|uniref:hypothetical protein n=1 Tax=Sulfuricurvum sp. TaxID=2025608 RepID=UPI00286E1F56|nr:hypothetical protein [Sulfuricurvum sp.]